MTPPNPAVKTTALTVHVSTNIPANVTVTQVPAGLTASPANLGFASLGDTASIVAVVADERAAFHLEMIQ